MTSIAPLPVVVPLGAAGVAAAVRQPPADPDRARRVAIAAALAEVVLASVAGARRVRAHPIVYWFGGWTPRHGVAIGISFAVDQLGAGAAVVCGIVVAAAFAERAPIVRRRVRGSPTR